jgi:hypothetical protein
VSLHPGLLRTVGCFCCFVLSFSSCFLSSFVVASVLLLLCVLKNWLMRPWRFLAALGVVESCGLICSLLPGLFGLEFRFGLGLLRRAVVALFPVLLNWLVAIRTRRILCFGCDRLLVLGHCIVYTLLACIVPDACCAVGLHCIGLVLPVDIVDCRAGTVVVAFVAVV